MEGTSYHSYPKVWNLGHPSVSELFLDEVIVEEKIDGSQYSFGKFDGEIKCRSKGAKIHVDAPEKMFAIAVEQVLRVADQLYEGWTYRTEYLSKPKHNTICYERTPINNLIIFDINTGQERYMPHDEKKAEAERLGFECVPLLFSGKVNNSDDLRDLLDTDSILGNSKVEGVVCKNYTRFGRDGHALLGKFVSEAFKERNSGDWKKRNPGGKDIIQNIGDMFRTDARWQKSVQHLQELGQLENSPRDIGILLKELHRDLETECGEEIKKILYQWCMSKVKRSVCAGFPEWYKQRLLDSQFEGE